MDITEQIKYCPLCYSDFLFLDNRFSAVDLLKWSCHKFFIWVRVYILD